MVEKNTLRRIYLDKRMALSAEEYESRNRRLVDLLLANINFHNFHCVHLFLPILAKKEVNTWLILEALREMNASMRFQTSQTLGNGQLAHYEIWEETRFKENRWGVPEPVDAKVADISSIDLVIIPLVTYDKMGQRIGYGKGYYDRFLKKTPQAFKLGVSLGPPLDRIHYNNSYDVKLDVCASPFMYYKF